MQVTIEVDSAKFKEFLEPELKAFPKEKLQELIHDAIVDQLHVDGMFKSLFVSYRTVQYGNKEPCPSELLLEAARRFDINPAFKEIEEDMRSYLVLHGHDMMVEALAKVMLKSMFNTDEFKQAVYMGFMQMRSEEK